MDEDFKNMIRDMYTVMLGVPGTDDKGMAGRSKKMEEKCESIETQLKQINGRVTTNTTWRKAFCWALGFMATFLGIFAGIYFA